MDIRLPLLAVALGAVTIGWGWREWSISSESDDDAVRITCKALGTKGPGTNTHVLMTDFVLAPDCIYESKDGKWTKVWLAALPIDSDYVKEMAEKLEKGDRLGAMAVRFPRPVGVVVATESVHNQRELDALDDAKELDGIVIPATDGLSGPAESRVSGAFGDLKNTKFLDVGRTRTNRVLSLLAMLGGAGAIVGVGVSAYLGRPSRRRGPPRTLRAPRTPLAKRSARSRW